MDFSKIKDQLLGKLNPEARKLVVAYAMQASVLSEIEASAIKAGASKTTLELVKNALPMVLSFLNE